MDLQLGRTIQAIHDAPQQAAIEFAGAGSQALAWLHQVPGSSRTVLEAADRYAPASLADLLGFAPSRFADPHVAQLMAHRAYLRARELSQTASVVGLGCTATLATDRAKRGDHRVCVATRDEKGTVTYELALTKGARTRAQEEALASLLLIRALAQTCGVKGAPELELVAKEIVRVRKGERGLLTWLSHQSIAWMAVGPQGAITAGQRWPGIALLSGSFNPLHQGHKQLAHAAEKILKRPVHFELTLQNADKPSISLKEAQRRLRQFKGAGTLILSWSALFRQKAAVFPNSVFVIGADTATRLIQPRFYENSPEKMRASLEAIRAAGCRFLVAGRAERGAWITLEDLEIPVDYGCLFEAIPPSTFRMDVSSTALRARLKRRSSARQ